MRILIESPIDCHSDIASSFTKGGLEINLVFPSTTQQITKRLNIDNRMDSDAFCTVCLSLAANGYAFEVVGDDWQPKGYEPHDDYDLDKYY